jgi:hypothetical protein
MIRRTNALVALTPTADHSECEGYFVKLSSGSAALVSSASDAVYGVILDGQPTTGFDSIACCWGGAVGVVDIKLAASPGTVNAGTLLELTANGTVKASTGTAGTILVAQALESGSANELIQAVLIRPVSVPASIDDGAVTAAKLAGAAVTGAKLHADAITPWLVTGADASVTAQDLTATGAVASLRILMAFDHTDGALLDKSIFTAGTDKFVQASGNYASDKILILTVPASA